MSSKKPHRSQQRFIVDEDLGRSFYRVLAESGKFDVQLFSDLWVDGTVDPEWIPLTAEKGLIVITHDKAIRKEHRDLVINAGPRIIVFSGKKPHEKAEWFVKSQAKIHRFVKKNKGPYFARFTPPSPSEIEKKQKPTGKIVLQK